MTPTVQARVFQGPGGRNAPPQRKVTHRLTKTKMYCPTGSRYMTRTNARKLFTGEMLYAFVRNNGTQRFPKQARPIRAHVTGTRLRVGCHVWSGESFQTLRAWALA